MINADVDMVLRTMVIGGIDTDAGWPPISRMQLQYIILHRTRLPDSTEYDKLPASRLDFCIQQEDNQ